MAASKAGHRRAVARAKSLARCCGGIRSGRRILHRPSDISPQLSASERQHDATRRNLAGASRQAARTLISNGFAAYRLYLTDEISAQRRHRFRRLHAIALRSALAAVRDEMKVDSRKNLVA
jgi:hypothetical protein